MLVLSRRSGESIIINDNVEVKSVEIKGDYVKVGITAPRSIPVHRKEIFEAIQRENARAAQSQTNKEGVAELEKNLDERSSLPEPEKEKNPEPKKRPKKPSS